MLSERGAKFDVEDDFTILSPSPVSKKPSSNFTSSFEDDARESEESEESEEVGTHVRFVLGGFSALPAGHFDVHVTLEAMRRMGQVLRDITHAEELDDVLPSAFRRAENILVLLEESWEKFSLDDMIRSKLIWQVRTLALLADCWEFPSDQGDLAKLVYPRWQEAENGNSRALVFVPKKSVPRNFKGNMTSVEHVEKGTKEDYAVECKYRDVVERKKEEKRVAADVRQRAKAARAVEDMYAKHPLNHNDFARFHNDLIKLGSLVESSEFANSNPKMFFPRDSEDFKTEKAGFDAIETLHSRMAEVRKEDIVTHRLFEGLQRFSEHKYDPEYLRFHYHYRRTITKAQNILRCWDEKHRMSQTLLSRPMPPKSSRGTESGSREKCTAVGAGSTKPEL